MLVEFLFQNIHCNSIFSMMDLLGIRKRSYISLKNVQSARMIDFATRLKQLDAYATTCEDFRVRTFGGAIITGVSSAIMFLLFISELHYYLTTEVQTELFVDVTRHQKLRINIDLVFPQLPCAFLSIDAMDVSGEQHPDLKHDIYKKRMDEHGQPVMEAEKHDLGNLSVPISVARENKTKNESRCGSCYGAATAHVPCCNSCQDVRTAYRNKGWALKDPSVVEQCKHEQWLRQYEEQQHEGCQVYGLIEVSKLAGNFHIAPGKSFQRYNIHIHDLLPFGNKTFNTSHQIRSLSFGAPLPGVRNPLDGLTVTSNSNSVMYQYFVKIIPTVHKKLSGEVIWSNQYSFTQHQRSVQRRSGSNGLPGFFVTYDLSPMLIQYTEKQRSFMYFLTGVCAIIGGVYTVAGLLDSVTYHLVKALKTNMDVGKTTS